MTENSHVERTVQPSFQFVCKLVGSTTRADSWKYDVHEHHNRQAFLANIGCFILPLRMLCSSGPAFGLSVLQQGIVMTSKIHSFLHLLAAHGSHAAMPQSCLRVFERAHSCCIFCVTCALCWPVKRQRWKAEVENVCLVPNHNQTDVGLWHGVIACLRCEFARCVVIWSCAILWRN